MELRIMDQDFDIEIVAVMGLECLEKHLSKCPIELELVEALSNTFVLKQNKVSEIAGFTFESQENDVYTFSMFISHKSRIPARKVVSQFSEFLRAAKLPHKITNLQYEVDFYEEWVNYSWPPKA
ncbi:hypothetical protein [Shewanella algae]|uniref:hypothetical protein n=2 Tax=Shewanella algae TaxID=38313 RepID=UPI0011A00ACC|nr:hypothetical protein [Shewanella algae]MBO2658695.1 hypothetical protein [Shewanella algae]